MNRDIPVQVAYDRTNRGVDTREASTANFLIDSEDRNGYNATNIFGTVGSLTTTSSSDFTITKPGQNLLSGFLTRIAMTEIQLTWNIFNVNSTNNSLGVSVRTVAGGAITNYTVSITQGNYTVQEALDALVTAMSTATGQTFTVVNSVGTSLGAAGRKAIQITGGAFTFAFYRLTGTPVSGPVVLNLAQRLGFITADFSSLPLPTAFFSSAWTAYKPNLLAYKYIDITSSQLASQQKVKDATTSNFDAIDVIYRWVFADGGSSNLSTTNNIVTDISYDGYGYPILQGYKPFTAIRYLSFPKQTRWDPSTPIGNLNFQTYTDQQAILTYIGASEAFEFKMLMLVSEV